MVNLKLLIPIVVIVVVVVAVLVLLLPSLTPSGETGGEQTATTPSQQQQTTIPETETKTPEAEIQANIELKEPTPEERARGVLAVAELNVTISFNDELYIKQIYVTIAGKKYYIYNYTTPYYLKNPRNYLLGPSNQPGPFRYEITSETEKTTWDKASRINVFVVYEYKGEEKTASTVIVLTQRSERPVI